ncbi:glycosyltransferase family 2 protein [Flavobacterium sp. DG2-3]|uniref:glycosyltransferase family 2 protein n=1 Tax=Flavobacterium sp. DG2-3 TaxID=3068317 RepID=UPI00273F3B5D|nr:galactosyltransferase-related protein [Flavobacterium sp. DG2-3]MDP5200680.1 galactosyltransferase-related protein [Flavobacterium sp. DG2-3]
MISIVLTNRDRDLRIVERSLASLDIQSDKDFKVFLVDYGSKVDYIDKLKELTKAFIFVELIVCPVQGQLWNKSRAINIALKKTKSPYFLVGDIDLMFHPDFIEISKGLVNNKKIYYFQYGFLSPEESKEGKDFDDYKVDFLGNDEVTGTTLFPTDVLMSVNGYDEFYHGWGAEDTDIHLRLKNAGLSVIFIDEKLLVKHQWHPKAYRSKNSSNPFHSTLERINHSYMHFSNASRRTKLNLQNEWGIIPLESDYNELVNNKADFQFILDSEEVKLSAILMQLSNFENVTVEITINKIPFKEKLKENIKKLFGKKSKKYLEPQIINDRILEIIVSFYRNNSYQYSFDTTTGEIQLKIKL